MPQRIVKIIALCLLLPAIFVPGTRRIRVTLSTLLTTITLLSLTACGGSQITPVPNRNTAAGVYQFLVTATSSAAGTAITQTATLNLTVQ